MDDYFEDTYFFNLEKEREKIMELYWDYSEYIRKYCKSKEKPFYWMNALDKFIKLSEYIYNLIVLYRIEKNSYEEFIMKSVIKIIFRCDLDDVKRVEIDSNDYESFFEERHPVAWFGWKI